MPSLLFENPLSSFFTRRCPRRRRRHFLSSLSDSKAKATDGIYFGIGDFMKLQVWSTYRWVKVGVHPILSEILRSLKKGLIEERELFLEHHQTVDPHARAPHVVRGLFRCPSTNL